MCVVFIISYYFVLTASFRQLKSLHAVFDLLRKELAGHTR